MIIDTHCHLEYDYTPKTTEDLVKEAREAGVSHLVTIGTELRTLKALATISERFPAVFHSVGIHPHEASSIETPAHLGILRKAAAHSKCVAIGEIGLDFHYDHSPRPVQLAGLKDQLDLAVELKKPVVIHAREAEADLLPALAAYAKKQDSSVVPGVIHCFTGTAEFGKACLDLGFMISFSGILTFKKSESLRECARFFPIDSLCVETDSPYLAPVPFRGKKCEPKMVIHTAEKLAEIKGLDYEEIAEATTRNARRLFGF